MRSASRGVALLALAIAAGQAEAQSTRLLTRADYESRLRGLWLGECIANWTGLRAEASRTAPPFFTDADWGTRAQAARTTPGAKKAGRSSRPAGMIIRAGPVSPPAWFFTRTGCTGW